MIFGKQKREDNILYRYYSLLEKIENFTNIEDPSLLEILKNNKYNKFFEKAFIDYENFMPGLSETIELWAREGGKIQGDIEQEGLYEDVLSIYEILWIAVEREKLNDKNILFFIFFFFAKRCTKLKLELYMHEIEKRYIDMIRIIIYSNYTQDFRTTHHIYEIRDLCLTLFDTIRRRRNRRHQYNYKMYPHPKHVMSLLCQDYPDTIEFMFSMIHSFCRNNDKEEDDSFKNIFSITPKSTDPTEFELQKQIYKLSPYDERYNILFLKNKNELDIKDRNFYDIIKRAYLYILQKYVYNSTTDYRALKSFSLLHPDFDINENGEELMVSSLNTFHMSPPEEIRKDIKSFATENINRIFQRGYSLDDFEGLEPKYIRASALAKNTMGAEKYGPRISRTLIENENGSEDEDEKVGSLYYTRPLYRQELRDFIQYNPKIPVENLTKIPGSRRNSEEKESNEPKKKKKSRKSKQRR